MLACDGFFWLEIIRSKNEIMLSKEALRKYGINNPNIGMEIKVEYTALNQNSTDGNSQEINFILSGYYIDFSGDSRDMYQIFL